MTLAFALLAMATILLGILAAWTGIPLPGGADQKTIVFSAALVWIIFGTILAIQATKPLTPVARSIAQAFLGLITVIATVGLFFGVVGFPDFIETIFVRAETIIPGLSLSPISLVTAGLAIPAAIALALVIRAFRPGEKPGRVHAVSILGWAICLVSFTFVLSYIYGSPLLHGTPYAVALVPALAVLFIGMALVAAAGPGAFPLRYLFGNSMNARLLRVLVPLVIVITLAENFVVFVLGGILNRFSLSDAVLHTAMIVIFATLTAFVVARVSGGITRELDRAGQELERKNEDLGAANEKLTSMQHELEQNVDELTRTARVLRESEERFRSVLNNSPDVLYRFNLTTQAYEYFSPACIEVYGYSPEEMIAMNEHDIGDRIHPDDRSRYRAEMGRIQAAGDGGIEIRWLTRNGNFAWLSVSIHMTIGAHGVPLYRYGFVRDVTKRRVSEDALRESEEKYRNLVKYAPAAIYEMNPECTKLLSVNEVMCEILGYSQEELFAMLPADLLDPPGRLLFSDRIKKKLKGEKTDGTTEYRVRKKDGSWMYADLNVGVTVTDDIPSRVVVIGQDITERRRMEEDLVRKNEDLNSLNQELTATQEELHQNIDELSRREQHLNRMLVEKEVLLSEIHHRVKNNLTAFISLLSLEGTADETPSGSVLKQDLQNRARSMALVHETLYRTNMYDEVDMGMYLTTLVDQIAKSFQSTRKVRTVVEANNVMLDIPRATPAGLIVNELVTNSFKYAFPEPFDPLAERNNLPTITVSLSRTNGSYELEFRDNGVGLPPDFDIETARSLGLKLVNFLARHQMRADVEVSSGPGTGFVFRF